MKITCRGCGKQTEAASIRDGGGYSVRDVMKETGFYPHPDGMAVVQWLCPNCIKEMGPHAEALHQKLGNFVMVDTLIKHYKALLEKTT